MTRQDRNPRRAYDRNGTMIPPATVRSCAANGMRTIEVFCHACHHGIILGLDGLPEAMAIPDVPVELDMRCRCGSRNIGVQLDIAAHYRKGFGSGRQGGPMPEGYTVVPWRSVTGEERARRIADGNGPDAQKPDQL